MAQQMDIISYVSQYFPENVYFERMLEFARANNLRINTADDFAKAFVASMKYDTPTIDIYTSSSFAIAQEFLGNLNDDDAFYARSRGGCWNMKYINGICKLITTRKVLETVYELYPSDD